jgi:hypothetical protein
VKTLTHHKSHTSKETEKLDKLLFLGHCEASLSLKVVPIYMGMVCWNVSRGSFACSKLSFPQAKPYRYPLVI